MANTDRAWEQWGQQDPYYGVVTMKQFHKDSIDQNRDAFFESGRDMVRSTLERFHRVFGDLPKGRALDFGCGVGRLTLALAEQFREVVGLDISTSMLAEARKNAAAGRGNAKFEMADDDLVSAPGKFDFVNSYIVLQHIPVARGLRLMRNLVGKVAPGGGFLIHFSVRNRGPLWQAMHWLKHNFPPFLWLDNLRQGRPLTAPTMQMNDYPVPQILEDLSSVGITEAFTFTEMHGNVMTVGIIGKRPA